MPCGTIVRIDPKGYGFITPFEPGAPDVWFSRFALLDIVFDKSLGQQVRYDVIPSGKGTGLKCRNVWPESEGGIMRGVITYANDSKGYCFIQSDGGRRIFANRTKFQNSAVSFVGFVGTPVDFFVVETERGPEADRVSILEDDGKNRDHGQIRIATGAYGFINPDANPTADLFFHKRELVGNDWPANLHGVRVTYVLSAGHKTGKPHAVGVRIEQ